MKYRVLVVDDMTAISGFLKTVLQSHGFEVEAASNGEAALAILQSASFDVLISDIAMEPMDGIDLLSLVVQQYPDLMAIMLTGFGELKSAATAMTLGAFDYLEKPVSIDAVLSTVKCAIAYGQARNGALDLELIGRGQRVFGCLVAQSVRMEHACSVLSHVVQAESNLYIYGEAGTGRRRIARAVHDCSERAQRPYLVVDCSSLEASSIGTSSLGGGEELLQMLGGGTLVFDRVDETPYELQKVLHDEIRLLQSADEDEQDSDDLAPRVIGIAAMSIEDRAEKDSFYRPLFKKVGQVPLRIPSLRERSADLISLAYYIVRERIGTGTPVPFVELAICDLFEAYNWPGNVSELEDALVHALDQAEEGRLCLQHLPENLRKWGSENMSSENHDLDTMFERKSSLLAFLKKKSRESVARIDKAYPDSA